MLKLDNKNVNDKISIESWSEFEKVLSKIRTGYAVDRLTLSDGSNFDRPVQLLFRGQDNAKHKLLTTLERKTEKPFDVLSYIQIAAKTVNELESFTDQKWGIPVYPDLEEEIQSKQDEHNVYLPIYNYLVYLRHHGYPSPLLDWTESPYIAAYFAYINAKDANPAVYCYIEKPKSFKSYSVGDPCISVQGPYVSTHKRHFAQKAMYTIATYWDYKKKQHNFCNHDLIFDQNNKTQDVLVQIELPIKDRIEALRNLSEYNINHFTLFQSEDALVKALEQKYFDLENA